MRRIAYGLIALLCCTTVLVLPRLQATAATSPACTVDYTVSSQWATGFVVQISITNDGPALSSWDLQYAYSGNQRLGSGWDATWSQSGEKVTASNASWNGSLGTGASVSIGAQFSYSGTNTAPTTFTLNGTACNGSGTPTPTPTPTTSPTASPTASPSTTPTVGPSATITSPAPNSEAPSGSTLTLSADASPGDVGTITSVTFYETNFCNGNTTTQVGAAYTAPYSVQWADVPVGNFSIAAVVSTSLGANAMSAVVELTTTSGGLPPPCATAPGSPVIVLSPPVKPLNSSTSNTVTPLIGFGSSGGAISSVTFTAVGGCGSVNTINIGTATAAPYLIEWVDPPQGAYTITAVADDGGTSVTSAPLQTSAGPNSMPPPCPTPPPTTSPTPTATPVPTTSPAPTPSPAAA